MDMYEFGEKCRVLNGRYKELFGFIPVQTDYDCTREEFLQALEKSIQEKNQIDHYLVRNAMEEEQ